MTTPRRARAGALTTRAYSDYWQGAGVDRTRLSDALAALADTADELEAVATKLGAPASNIYLGLDASETTVKRRRWPITAWSISPPTGSLPATSRAWANRRWR